MNLYKKIVLGVILAGLLLSPSLLLPFETKKAEAAGLPVVDLTAMTDRIWNAAKTVIGQKIKKMILDRIVDATVQWIKNGFKNSGGPFLDVGAMLQDVGNQAIGEIANQAIPVLCGNFKLNLAFSLTQEPKPFSQNVECSLTNVVDNVNNIFEDFKKESKGRWITYNSIWEPQNNYYGSALIAEDKKLTITEILTTQKNIEANMSLGFKAQEQCLPDKGTGQIVCKTVTPGSIIGRQIQQQVMPKDNAILSADDMATYLGAIADAVLYRYTILANGGLKKLLGYSSADIDKENTNKAWDQYTQSSFSQIDSITFQNNRALFLDEIRTVLTTKRSTLTYLNQSINTEDALLTTLEKLQSCTLPDGSTSAQVTAMSALSTNIDDANTTISNLETRKSQLEGEISDLENAITQFNQYTDSDNTLMVNQYSALRASGALDSTAAATALTDAQNESASLQQNAKNLLESTAPTGYLDIITICASQ